MSSIWFETCWNGTGSCRTLTVLNRDSSPGHLGANRSAQLFHLHMCLFVQYEQALGNPGRITLHANG